MSAAGQTSGSLWRVPLALRLALRDLRGGLRGFRIFIACIFLGVAAITGIGSSARILSDSLAQEGQKILGGDIAFRIAQQEADAEQISWMRQHAKVSSIATMRAMARSRSGEASLAELKAVDSAYPLTGSVVLADTTEPLARALAVKDGVHGVIADPALLVRLGLKQGDTFFIGDSVFQLRAVLKSEPDKLADGFGLGPRVLMTQDAFRASGLVQPGALIRWTYRLLLTDARSGSRNNTSASDAVLRQTLASARQAFPDAGWRVTTRANVSPAFTRNLNRFAQFLTLVALTALMVGGVGVANAVRGFMERKQHDLAVFKALGASGGYIFRMSIIEVLLAAAIGIGLGALVGAALPYGIALVFGSLIPIPFTPSVYPSTLLTGCAFGFLTALAFVLLPLGHVHDTRVSALFRDRVESDRQRLRTRYVVMTGAVAAIFLGAVILTANDRFLALVYVAVALGVLLVLRLVGMAIIHGARRAPKIASTELRLAIANIHRPGAGSQAVVLSLGLGMTLLVALTIMDLNFRSVLKEGIPGKTPSFFFLDIQREQTSGFEKFLKSSAPGVTLDVVPMMRGRVLSVNGVPASKVQVSQNAAWALRGDRGITYAADLPAGSSLTNGQWWKPDYSGEPLVSVETKIAEGIGLKIGDILVFNVLGRKISAKVASFRDVNWRTFGINFVFVFSPSAFAGAPHANIATATFTGGDRGQQELRLLKSLAAKFPTVTSVRIRETLDALNKVSEQLSFAMRGATSIALIASILVLAGAVSAGQRARIYDAVILKALGATRRRLLASILLEYGLLGLVTGLFALIAGSLAAWVVMTQVMKLDSFSWYWGAAGWAVVLGLVITVFLGLAGTWRILDEKPARRLRSL
ncbi:MAG: FtsX-like permease family protein [Beijerinckiaceae bacterium]|nr:FtsX-like permease family protein [Beijerinckiaceae bacterium]